MGIPVEKVLKGKLKDPEFARKYEEGRKEFWLVQTMIDAREAAGLSQAELAKRMSTTQPMIARIESGRFKPSIATLEKFAKALNMTVRVSFEPVKATKRPPKRKAA